MNLYTGFYHADEMDLYSLKLKHLCITEPLVGLTLDIEVDVMET